MELGKMDNRTGFGMGHMERLRNRASYLLKDSLKIARVALVDVSTAELMTEDATNADEWGPTTKQMAEISESSNNSEEYLRIVHVLHKRFALNTQKYWRQIHKSLILLEYLLCHGPEHLMMEFRQDKGRLEEFARFVYVDWKGVDRGSAVQRRAKHVLHLLMDEAFYKNERTNAQKISKVISGFGSESLSHMFTRSKSHHSNVPRSQSASSLIGIHHDSGEDSSTLLADEDDHCNSEPETPSTSGRSSWGAFSSSSGNDSLNGSGRSTNSSCSDGNPNEDLSPASTLSFRKTSQILDMDSVASEFEELAVIESTPPLMQKLPPPPPRAGYKCARPPQSGSRVRWKQSESAKLATVPDLITI
ncbi:hypothetical protein KC19_2G072200 [Ceratodon purpureus]|uniref:ENTH domain-containing protein n=1 Tax=Ceratodon purpureus TaxID=3225 RepID=A0A8T0IR32_CERPU|nr:hypothetical protein KC19_2G072200 [Ceratodon purpureus]KAG0586206.1 hypothetical protein KC19_2G072200 [Ceratodon purpureus]KAG0586208.1 hypothetical protein KC19_2G072200 [Ceratodon purpureus]KAG0586210.1 hypothetical protein KC19_2G072200 [Ceratodon purpureus]